MQTDLYTSSDIVTQQMADDLNRLWKEAERLETRKRILSLAVFAFKTLACIAVTAGAAALMGYALSLMLGE